MSAGHLHRRHETIALLKSVIEKAIEQERARLLGRLEDPAPWYEDAKAALELLGEKEEE